MKNKWISKKYRMWISEQPCVRCGAYGPSDPHHEDHGFNNSGMGMKPSDAQLVPLCFKCHRIDRANIGPDEFWGNIDYKKEIINLLSRYLKECNIK